MKKPVTVATALVTAPVAALTACTSNQPANNQPSSSSSVSSTSASTSAAPGAQTLTTQLKTADGTPVANATFEFANGYATVTVETIANHILSPGFHGMHIHEVGKCEANSVAPTGGPPGDFLSAGGHYQAPGHTGHPASGDLTSLEVRSDGAAKLVTTTDAFTASDLLAGDKTALMIHQDSDNFGNIPDRYMQKNGAPGPDQETLATGDAGKRVACGVIGSASASSTTTTSAATSAATTTATQAPTGGTTTTVPPSATTGASTPTLTSSSATSLPPSGATTSPAPGGG